MHNLNLILFRRVFTDFGFLGLGGFFIFSLSEFLYYSFGNRVERGFI